MVIIYLRSVPPTTPNSIIWLGDPTVPDTPPVTGGNKDRTLLGVGL